jgi:translation initiation factor 3 subunit E
VVEKFRQDKAYNLQFLQEEFQIGPEHVEALYQYARFQYNCGMYSVAAELLQSYRTLCTNSERNMSALWGKLAAEILMHEAVNIAEAREDVFKLKEAIDNQTFAPPLMQLQQRTWLLHWALYVFWNHDNGRNDIIDLYLSPAYLSAIQVPFWLTSWLPAPASQTPAPPRAAIMDGADASMAWRPGPRPSRPS